MVHRDALGPLPVLGEAVLRRLKCVHGNLHVDAMEGVLERDRELVFLQLRDVLEDAHEDGVHAQEIDHTAKCGSCGALRVIDEIGPQVLFGLPVGAVEQMAERLARKSEVHDESTATRSAWDAALASVHCTLRSIAGQVLQKLENVGGLHALALGVLKQGLQDILLVLPDSRMTRARKMR